MIITTEILFEGIYDVWQFKVNEEGFIDTKINGIYSDTLYDLGKIQDIKHLEKIVKHLMKCWKAKHTKLLFN